MVDFNLADAHPDYRREIPEILLPLTQRYPGAELASVSLYAPKPRDTSMGATFPGGHIRLNPYWFAREPAHLKNAAQRHPMIEVGGVEIGWHGNMPEAAQVLVHEFGHVLTMSPDAREFVKWGADAWRFATKHIEYAPTGYALTDKDEFLAECFACCELASCEFLLRDNVEKFLSRLRAA